MQTKSGMMPRRTARIPVIATLSYRAMGMDDFKTCHVLNVSTLALEIILDHALPETTVVTISARSGDSAHQYHHVVGQVLRVQQLKGRWMHVVTASTQRPWSPLFIYDVVCSTFNPVVENSGREYDAKPQYAELEKWFDLVACEATAAPERPVGLETAEDHASPNSD